MLDAATRVLAVLLFVGATLHAYGSLLAFRPKTPERVWSLGSAGFAAFLAVFAWLIAGRHDATLWWLLAAGCLGWGLIVGAFGRAIGNLADPRVLYHVVVAALLAAAAVIGAAW